MTQTVAIKLLNAAATTGDGPVFNLEFPQLAAAVQAEIAGTPTQAVINLMALRASIGQEKAEAEKAPKRKAVGKKRA